MQLKTSNQSRSVAATGVRCPACDGKANQIIYEVKDVPVHSCILLDSREAALNFPRKDIQLAFCPSCAFVFNRIFDPSSMQYSVNFEESQHFSETFNGFARSLAQEIASECDVAGKQVLEIGCGKGEFLLELCRIGNCSGVGIDPGFRHDRIADKHDDRVTFVVECFGRQHSDIPADVIICRHTLEHIPNVAEFVRLVHRVAQRANDAHVVFETPDVERVLREGAFWDIYYEHCSYFSTGTHARLFRRCGLAVSKLALVYDRQYIVQTASANVDACGATACEPLPLESDIEHMREMADQFPCRVSHILGGWRSKIAGFADRGQRTVLWGGGSKGVSFLTTLGLRNEIDRVVDINPFKQGKFMPGSGHRVVAPQDLIDRPPDVVIVMNPIYLTEVRETLGQLGLDPEVISV